MNPAGPRAAVIGARRRRQGLGAYLAGFLDEAGAEVVAVCGTTPETAAAAADALAPRLRRRPTPYADAALLLASETPELVVIASPDETHAAYLRLALQHGAHVLCEKPVCWGGPDPAGAAKEIGVAFLAAGRHLIVNAQLPFALPTYRRLFPDVEPARAGRFWMRSSPSTQGGRMIPAALPHPLALLMAASPKGPTAVSEVEWSRDPDSGAPARVRFVFTHSGGRIQAEVVLRSVPEQPRPMAYGFDEHIAWREVELPGYRMRLRDGERTVPLPDPTPLLVRSVLARLRQGPPTALDPSVHPGMLHLARLQAAWDRDMVSPSGSGDP